MDNIIAAVMDLAEKHLGSFKIRNGQIVTDLCPMCHGGDNGDRETFSVGLHNGAYNCLRGSCGVKGNFRDLCNFFGEKTPEDLEAIRVNKTEKKKVYAHPEVQMKALTDEAIMYMATRRISLDTLTAFNVCCDEHGNLMFPFYRNKVLTYVKYRAPRKYTGEAVNGKKPPKSWQYPGCEAILWGMDDVDTRKPLIITEGEIDAMSIYEAGCHNVVSVPCGCNNLDWIENCYEWLEQFNEIIIFGDHDEPGREMISMVQKRLGEYRCLTPNEYPIITKKDEDGNIVEGNRSCKDANEILYCYGAAALKKLVEECKPTPIKGIINVADIKFVDPTSIPKIYTRIPTLDDYIDGLREGTLTCMTGKRGDGKSTLSGTLALNAIEQGEKVCVYSGELSDQNFLEWILLQATPSQYIGVKKDPKSSKLFPCVDENIEREVKNWIRDKMFLFDNASVLEEKTQDEAVMKVFEFCAKRYGCKLFVADNLMSMLTSADEENKAQAKLAAKLKAFAVKYRAMVVLVCHPRKTKAGEQIGNDDVSGSSAITNLADNVLCIKKPDIAILKNRAFGRTGVIKCTFNPANRRIFETERGDNYYRYSWMYDGVKWDDERKENVYGNASIKECIKIPQDRADSHEEFAVQLNIDERGPF